jgi:anti-sigma B factor antagonist
MEVNVQTSGSVTVVELAGELDGKSSAEAQEKILSVIPAGGKTLLDMRKVSYMSSAGLRMLLSIYRKVTGKNGKVVLVGVIDSIRDTMSVTGFLKFFVIHETVPEGMAALEG